MTGGSSGSPCSYLPFTSRLGSALRLNPWLLLPGAVLLVYLNSFAGVFQFDDYQVIVNYPPVHSWSAWLYDLPRGIRPLLKLTYTLNWTMGPGVFGFHLFNMALHAANTVLLYFLFLNVAGPGAPAEPSRGAALFFAVHPAMTEAVTYISGRSASLMSLFYLASLLAYARGSAAGAEDCGARDRRRSGRFQLYLLSPLFFLLAVGSKETAVTLCPSPCSCWNGRGPAAQACRCCGNVRRSTGCC